MRASVVSQTDETTIELESAVPIDSDLNQVIASPPDHVSEEGKAEDSNSEDLNSTESRIRQLELALEQCQIYIDELKEQLSDQAFLEEQLCSTEDYSHIQQKAINTLRDQLAQCPSEKDLALLKDQREALSSQVDQQLQTISELQSHCDAVDGELLKLKSLNRKLEAELQLALDTDVESTQQRIIAQQTTERLRSEIRSQEDQLKILEDRLQKGEGSQRRLRMVINALQNSQKSDSQKNLAIRDLSSSLLMAQDKIASLENECSSQSLMQAQLQQASFELEETIKENHERAESQERQIAEMQEQILHQAQQSREFETAVQHWKDRSEKYEHFLGRLFSILDDLPAESSQLLDEQYRRLINLRDQNF